METVASHSVYMTMIRLSVSGLVEIFASLGLYVFRLSRQQAHSCTGRPRSGAADKKSSAPERRDQRSCRVPLARCDSLWIPSRRRSRKDRLACRDFLLSARCALTTDDVDLPELDGQSSSLDGILQECLVGLVQYRCGLLVNQVASLRFHRMLRPTTTQRHSSSAMNSD